MSESKARSQGGFWKVAVLISGIVLFVFRSAARNEFLNWDDDFNFVRNHALRLPFPAGLKWAWSARLLEVYQPLGWNLMWIEIQLGGLSSSLMHAVNVVLHAANSCLLYAVLLELCPETGDGDEARSERNVGCALAALFFAVHPLRVEAVAWASSQPGLWSACFALAAALAYCSARRTRSVRERRGRDTLGIFLCLCACLCKPAALSLPLVLIIMDRYVAHRRVASGKGERFGAGPWVALGYLLVMGMTITLAFWARGGSLGRRVHRATSPLDLLFHPLVVVGNLMSKTFLPVGLSAYYPFPSPLSVSALTSDTILLPLLAVLVVSGLAWLARGRFRSLKFALLAIVVLLCPYFGAAISEGIAFADRFSYFPAMAFSGALAVASSRRSLPEGRLPARLAAQLVIAVLGCLTVGLIPIWHDSEALWKHTAHRNDVPHPEVQTNLAANYLEQGDFTQAEAAIDAALTIDPGLPEAHNIRGLCALQRGDLKRAKAEFETALKIFPEHAGALSNLGFLLSAEGQNERALDDIRKAEEIAPGDPKIQENEARVLERQGRFVEAISPWSHVVEANPLDGEAHNHLGNALAAKGDLPAAADQFKLATSLSPDNAFYHFNFAIMSERLGFSAQARRELKKALRLEPHLEGAVKELKALESESSRAP